MGMTTVEWSGGGGGACARTDVALGVGAGAQANAEGRMQNAEKRIRRIDFCILHSAFCIHMKYVNLGTSGLKVSRLCLGTMTYGSKQWRPWILDEVEARPFFRRAIEAGISFFDTADMYSNGASEEVTGRALRELAPRDEVVIATKVFFPLNDKPNMGGLSRKHILSAIDLSLRRLGVDYVDLYQIHRFDYHTPIEETIDALDDVVRAGKARYIGASSMYAWQFAKMLATQDERRRTRFVSM